MTSDEVELLRDELKQFYRKKFDEIKTSPLDPRSLRKLQEIYVHLVLHGDENIESVSFDRLCEFFANEHGKRRIALIGEAGVGKTTLLYKIAYDWAHSKRLHYIEFLIFVPLREIKKRTSFREILKDYIPNARKLYDEKINKYMETNQRNIMILLDGLDEYNVAAGTDDARDDLTEIIKGDKLKYSPVVVATRPWRADQITNVASFHEIYMRVRVEGFTKKDVKKYINIFFKNDTVSAESLSHLATEGSLVAQTMAPYPIFCCMLCHMWKVIQESDRERVKKLQTFSELIQKMINALVQQFQSKVTIESAQDAKYFQTRCKGSFVEIGEIAFNGLLNRQLAFNKDVFEHCEDAMNTACEIGVLSSRSVFTSSKTHDTPEKGVRHLVDVSFPHKLLQEYLAAQYLASVYRMNPIQFEKLLKDKVLDRQEELKYLVYFTAAQGKEGGKIKRPLIDLLCKTNMEHKNIEFLVDLAFECHDPTAITPIIDILQETNIITISQSEKHTLSSYMYILAVYSNRLVSIF